MINNYGENDFLITYDNKYYFPFNSLKQIGDTNTTTINFIREIHQGVIK